MPIYEYRCSQCEKEFEYQQRMSEPAKTVCEECGGELERLISRTAFQFKGGGWYKDLYASAKPAESKSETKTEAKTEAKDKKTGGDSSSGGGGGDAGGGGSSTPPSTSGSGSTGGTKTANAA